MFDLHTHTILSDGELLPSELARYFEVNGYKAIAITDHVDASNIKTVVPAIVEFCKRWPKHRIKILPGIELTHIPLEQFGPLIRYARKNGIKIIVAHGETVTEPVLCGTNRRALLSDIDVLAHPGNISAADVVLAKKRNIPLEISTRKSHGKANKHVLALARKLKAPCVINSDAHDPDNVNSAKKLQAFCKRFGISQKEFSLMCARSKAIVQKAGFL